MSNVVEGNFPAVDLALRKDRELKQQSLDLFDALPENTTEETKHWAAGVAVCMGCRNEWPAVVPLGVTSYQCPACHAHKGHMKYEVLHAGDEWTCACGNSLFRVTPTHIYCPNCGVIPDLPPA